MREPTDSLILCRVTKKENVKVEKERKAEDFPDP
jgi:hypothetical protein